MSSVVQNLYHALAMHDRLSACPPCPVLPSSEDRAGSGFEQQWFPGTHYDLGRKAFRFIQPYDMDSVRITVPDLFLHAVEPNHVLADCVMKWMLDGIRDVAYGHPIPLIPSIDRHIAEFSYSVLAAIPRFSAFHLHRPTFRIVDPKHDPGSGDVSGDLCNIGPPRYRNTIPDSSRSGIRGALNRLLRKDAVEKFRPDEPTPAHTTLSQQLSIDIQRIVRILTATTDRRIRSGAATTYLPNYMVDEIIEAAKMHDYNYRYWVTPRYPSRAYEDFRIWTQVFGGENGQKEKEEDRARAVPTISTFDSQWLAGPSARGLYQSS